MNTDYSVNTTELITPGSWHDSIGDIALMQAIIQQMALRGIPTIPRCEALNENQPCIIGGGRLLCPADVKQWSEILAPYRIPGPHLVNAAQVTGRGDFSYLKDYLYVGVRDQRSLEAVREHCDPVLVPCTATLLERPRTDYIRKLPGLGFWNKLIGTDYCVIDYDLPEEELNLEGRQYVRIDTRHWSKRKGHEIQFNHRNPDVILAIVSEASAVLCSTLHLSIFALAMDVPFACFEKSRGKITDYWMRAELPQVMTNDRSKLLETAFDNVERVRGVRREEIRMASEHVDNMARIIKDYRVPAPQ